MGLWEDEVAKCSAEFPKLKIKRFGDDKFSSFLKKIFSGAAGMALWNTIYVKPEEFGTERGAMHLSHEIVHIRDQHRWHVIFFLSYWLILPVGPSLKAIWEWRGYREDLRWIREHPESSDPERIAYLEDYYCQWVAFWFCSPMYLWMWPFKNAVYQKAKRFMAGL